jgi:hypothetical protein
MVMGTFVACSRHCESEATKQSILPPRKHSGLLRFARNDDQIDSHDNNALPDNNASAIIEA